MENELEKVLESKFFCPSRFAQEIESLVIENNGMNYIDAIVHFCDQNSIDVESVPKLLSKPLKEKIKYEAMELNFLKKSSRAKLPLWFHFCPKNFPAKKSLYYFFDDAVWCLQVLLVDEESLHERQVWLPQVLW